MQCPQCHRPLPQDAEDVYICCAGATLGWRCRACSRRREGFALPYGRCPDCGGELELLDHQAQPGPAGTALAAVRRAFEIELGGRAFYQRSAAEAPTPAMRALFERFALMEGEHLETLARRYHLDPPQPSPALRLELAALFAGVDPHPQDPARLFELAIALERRAAAFFTEHARALPAGSAERRLYEELAAEELEHASMLATEARCQAEGRPGLFAHDLGGRPLAAGATPAAAAAADTLNAAEVLLAAGDGDALALVCGEQALSRAELRAAVARAGAAWRARGVAPGERVAIRLDDGVDAVVAYLGAIWAGAVAVGVNPHLDAPSWQAMLDEAGFGQVLAQRADDTPPAWRRHMLSPATWREELARQHGIEPHRVAPDTPALWCHSSGTAARPKTVVHAHRFALGVEGVSAAALADGGLGLRPQDRLYASSRLFFAYPLANSLFAGLKIGATVILDPRWPNPATVLEVLQRQRASVLFSVPSLLRGLLHEGLAPALAEAGLRLCVSAGEALPAALRQAWADATAVPLVNGFGCSETLVLALTDAGHGLRASPGHAVRPLAPCAPGQPTRLLIHGPALALGYLDRPQAQRECFVETGFAPLDLFVGDAAAGWHHAGREDALVKLSGRWVNLVELEQQLAGPSAMVHEAALVTVADGDGLDALALFYVADDPVAADADLQRRAAALPTHQRPRWRQAVPALPRTATGKLMRRRLRELLRPEPDTPAPAVAIGPAAPGRAA